jgi:hypothetical protein
LRLWFSMTSSPASSLGSSDSSGSQSPTTWTSGSSILSMRRVNDSTICLKLQSMTDRTIRSKLRSVTRDASGRAMPQRGHMRLGTALPPPADRPKVAPGVAHLARFPSSRRFHWLRFSSPAVPQCVLARQRCCSVCAATTRHRVFRGDHARLVDPIGGRQRQRHRDRRSFLATHCHDPAHRRGSRLGRLLRLGPARQRTSRIFRHRFRGRVEEAAKAGGASGDFTQPKRGCSVRNLISMFDVLVCS